MKAYHICYHTDEDGNASAAIIYEYLKRVNKLDNRKSVRYYFYKIDYTVNLKDILVNIPSGDEIYFVDYSFSNKDNLKYVLKLSNNNITVTWIDHHKTSMDIINGNEYKDINLDDYNYPNFYYFIDTNYCGAYLAYVYAYCKLNISPCMLRHRTHYILSCNTPYIPLYIKYIDSWDSWKHNMPDTTEFNFGMRSMYHTPKSTISSMLNYNSFIINKLFSDDYKDQKIVEQYMERYIKNIISKGKTIKEYQNIENESLCNNYGFEFDIIDKTNKNTRIYHCFAVNRRGNSTMFGDRINKYDVVVPFQYDGAEYIYSLYTSKEDVDCEDLAKKLGSYNKLGGGGHTKAAGFQTLDLLFAFECKVYITNKLFRKNEYNITSDILK